MINKCEYSGKTVDVSGWVLLSGDGDISKVNEKNGLTVSKWACPCGKSVDVKPVAGSTGTVRWHDRKAERTSGTGGEGRKAGTNAGTVATLAVFLANVAGLFMAGELEKAQADAVAYCRRLTDSIADRQAAIDALQRNLDSMVSDANKAKTGLLRGAAMIPEDVHRIAFGVALAEAFEIRIPETVQE